MLHNLLHLYSIGGGGNVLSTLMNWRHFLDVSAAFEFIHLDVQYYSIFFHDNITCGICIIRMGTQDEILHWMGPQDEIVPLNTLDGPPG